MSRQSGAPGIALAGALFMMVQCVVLVGIWTRRHHGAPELRQLLLTLSKVLAISLVGGVICFVTARSLHGTAMVHGLSGRLGSLLVLCGSGLPAGALVLLVFAKLGILDPRDIVARLLKHRKRAQTA
jgi:hypothetical protein